MSSASNAVIHVQSEESAINPFQNHTPALGFLQVLKLSILFCSKEQLDGLHPLPPWRKKVQYPCRYIARAILFIAGYYWIPIHGQVPPQLPPIIVCNHRTFIDMAWVYYMFGCSFVAKWETKKVPVLGAVSEAVQCVYVKRSETKSRQETMEAITKRTKEPGWPPTLVFPEGTIANGRCLICFKQGAFTPGTPVLPVVLTYPYKHLDVSWVSAGPSTPSIMMRMLCQFVNRMEAHVLDVYQPSLQEQQNPVLYAENVREKCARAINLPTTNHTFEDMLLLARALQLNLPSSVLNLEIEQVKKIYKITLKDALSILERFRNLDKNLDGFVDFAEFLNLMNLPNNGYTRKLFRMFDSNHNGLIDFKEFVSGLFLLSNNMPAKETIELTFQALDGLHNGTINFPQFTTLFKNSMSVTSQEQLEKLFTDIDTDKNGVIDAKEFLEYATAHPEFCFLFQAIAQAIKNNSNLEVSSMVTIQLKSEIEASTPVYHNQ